MAGKTILVVNDDSDRCPLLVPLLDALAAQPYCAELRPVIPKVEVSWIAQAITRFDELEVSAANFGSHGGYRVTGTPADCASLGINNLYDSRPDMIVSGINMGTNAGLAFYLSSGTIGGAVEGMLAEVPAVALSAHMPQEVFGPWKDHNEEVMRSHEADWQRIAAACARVVGQLIAVDAWRDADVLTVNTPWKVNEHTPLTVTRFTQSRFEALFAETGENRYRHKILGLKNLKQDAVEVDSALPGDIQTIEADEISVTPVRYRLASDTAQALARRLN